MERGLILTSAPPPNCSSQNSSAPPSPGARDDPDRQSSSPSPLPMCAIAVPPPPPPPPPLPPPPSLGSHDVRRRSMKKLNWDTIPSQRVLGKLNVWTSKRRQRDLVLDIPSMEELFSHVDKRASLPSSRGMGPKAYEGMQLFPQEPPLKSKVTILDSKKSMNIGIFLRHFKRPVTEMVQDICKGNWLRFGTGKLQELCKLLPEETEVKLLRSFNGSLLVLPEADQFMVLLVKVPGYEERLKTMMLREEFFPLMEEVKNSVAVMTKAANELLDCDDLHSVIRLVLKAGNYMNAGGYSATSNAIGFRMTSLLKLADTKANKPGMNLMHYVAKQAEEMDAELLLFSSQLGNIGLGARICKEEVIADYEREIKKVKEVKLYSSRQPDLLQQMETFLLRAEAKLVDLEVSLQELKSVSNSVAEYFCEDPATFKLEECCSIFHSFCKRFETAVQENRGREAAEQRRKQKESVRIAAKRRSAVAGSLPAPQRDAASSGLESALHSLLSTAPEGVVRCRKNALPTVGDSLSECSSRMVPPVVKSETTPRAEQEKPKNKTPILQKEDENAAEPENAERAQRSREITRPVPRHRRSSVDVSGTPGRSERAGDTPATPSTPRPRSRDYFFSEAEGVGSPWTILSPFTCPKRAGSRQDRPRLQRRLSSAPGGDDLEDGVWESDEGNCLPNSYSQEYLTSGSCASPPERSNLGATSSAPIFSAVSIDENCQSPGSGFRLGDLFQRSVSQRSSHSSGSRTENMRGGGGGGEYDDEEEVGVSSSLLGRKGGSQGQGSASGFKSFFHIGSRSEDVDTEERFEHF
ncbi:LOW QUALITY PROTEIN: FH2 domain containing 3 [Spinachia spinachia]